MQSSAPLPTGAVNCVANHYGGPVGRISIPQGGFPHPVETHDASAVVPAGADALIPWGGGCSPSVVSRLRRGAVLTGPGTNRELPRALQEPARRSPCVGGVIPTALDVSSRELRRPLDFLGAGDFLAWGRCVHTQMMEARRG